VASFDQVGDGLWRQIKHKWEGIKIWQMVKDMLWSLIWPWPSIGKEFKELWTVDWTNAAHSLYAFRTDSVLHWLHDLWTNFLHILDFPLALWRRLNNVCMLLMGWVSIILILGGAILGGAIGAMFFGVGALPGAGAGAMAGLEAAGAIGEVLLWSYLAGESTNIIKLLIELFTARLTDEEKNDEYSRVADSAMGLGIALVLMLLAFIAGRLAGVVVEAIRGKKLPPDIKPPDEKPPAEPEKPKTPMPSSALAPGESTVEWLLGKDAKAVKDWKYYEGDWPAERLALHDKLIEQAKKDAQAFADAMEGEPTLYAARGNTAAGKTRALKGNVPELKAGIDASGDMRAVNPDNFKKGLIEGTNSDPKPTTGQVHQESSMLTERLQKELLDPENGLKKTGTNQPGNVLIDKRLLTVDDVAEYFNLAQSTGRKFALFDVDAPLESSLSGVLEREQPSVQMAKGAGAIDPLPPFDVVAKGFKGIRDNRLKVIKFLRDKPGVKYDLYSGGKLIAKIENGTFEIIDAAEYGKVVEMAPEDLLANKVIDEALIDDLTKDITDADYKAKKRAALEKYKGKTWKQALDEHAAGDPQKPTIPGVALPVNPALKDQEDQNK
jgi:hypothetical protein